MLNNFIILGISVETLNGEGTFEGQTSFLLKLRDTAE